MYKEKTFCVGVTLGVIIEQEGSFMSRKTGFILANLHQGTGVQVWEYINQDSLLPGDSSIFVFPGGRLGYKKADEYLRNSIYRFAIPENIDGAVVWGSTLAGTATWKEAESFVQMLSKTMPVISMGIEVEGVPSVNFDAYSGTYRMVEHMIKRHGARKIAFLRGPENHESAQDRFQAYLDALRDNSIAFNPKLVSSPTAWGEGEAAIKEIVEKNGMVPSKDFSALVCPSDLMNRMATIYLEEKGYYVPDDVATAGFNDSPEAYLSYVESTTVRIPFKEMVETSFSLIEDMEKDRDGIFPNISLPSIPLYRRSCGCEDPFGSAEKAQKTIKTWEDYETWIFNRLTDKEAAKVVIYLLKDMFMEKIPVDSTNRRHYEELCWRYLKHGGTMKLFFAIVKWAHILMNVSELSLEEMTLLHDILMEQAARVSAAKNISSSLKNKVFNALGADLLKVLSFRDLGSTLSKRVPELGISKAFIFLSDMEGGNRLVTGFSEGKIWDESQLFDSNKLYPEDMENEFERGVYIVLPLFYDSSVMGYMIVKNDSCSSEMVENIRINTSATLQAISLYKIACIKSQKAEEAEKQSSQFYATLAENLREPLSAIKAMADCGDLDEKILLALSTKAEHILQLSLSDKGELSIDMRTTPSSFLLREIEDRGISVSSPPLLPALNLDMGKICEILDYLTSEARVAGDSLNMKIFLEEKAFVLRTYGNIFDVSAISYEGPSMLLCEKIMVLHGGTFRFGKGELDIVLPFPSISGLPSSSNGDKGILFISSDNDINPKDYGFEKISWMKYEDVVQKIGDIPSYSAIAWNTEDESKSSNVALTVLRNHKETKDMPFLCYGSKESSSSLNTTVEGALLHNDRAIFYSFGKFPKTLDKLKDFGTILEIKDPSELDESKSAALFIIQKIDPLVVESIRRKRKFSKTPILVVKDKFSRDDAEKLSPFPEVLMVNTSITESEDFITRVVSLIGGDELLPPLTSVLVKRAIAYLNEYATHSVSRWQIAASVNISEDYLTRIFRKEVGLSPWDYLNRFRIQIASKLLLETGASISEIASMTGFQDQAYFCRVFRKVKGFPPGNIRSRNRI